MTREEEAEFERYLVLMRPWVVGITRRCARGAAAPYLEQADLVQEGLAKLWRVWVRHRGKPIEEVCRIGTVAVQRACITAYNRVRSVGVGRARAVSLDEPRGKGAAVLARTAGEDGARTVFVRLALHEVKARLSGLELRLLEEVLNPTAEIRALLGRRTGHETWTSIRERELAAVLGVTLPQLRAVWRRVQALIGEQMNGYRSVSTNPQQEVRKLMEHIGAMFPQEPLTQEEPETTQVPAETVGAQPEPAKKEKEPKAKKEPKVKKEPAKKVPKAKKEPAKKEPAKKEPAKKVPKAKKAPKAAKGAKHPPDSTGKSWADKTATEKVDSGRYRPRDGETLLKVGTEVEYLGGSRATWLRKGTKGKVFRLFGNTGPGVRYGCRFDGRSTMLSSKFVRAVA